MDLDALVPRLNFIVLGASALLAAVIDFSFLPETKGEKMVDTVDELMELINKGRKSRGEKEARREELA